MDTIAGPKPPLWYQVAAVAALLWTLFGIFTYLAHVGLLGETRMLSEAERQLEASIPLWVTAAYAIAVFVGAAGALGLILRRAWARPLLIVSAVAVLAQELWTLFVSDAPEVHGTFGVVMPVVIVTASLLLVWMANSGVRKRWLR